MLSPCGGPVPLRVGLGPVLLLLVPPAVLLSPALLPRPWPWPAAIIHRPSGLGAAGGSQRVNSCRPPLCCARAVTPVSLDGIEIHRAQESGQSPLYSRHLPTVAWAGACCRPVSPLLLGECCSRGWLGHQERFPFQRGLPNRLKGALLVARLRWLPVFKREFSRKAAIAGKLQPPRVGHRRGGQEREFCHVLGTGVCPVCPGEEVGRALTAEADRDASHLPHNGLSLLLVLHQQLHFHRLHVRGQLHPSYVVENNRTAFENITEANIMSYYLPLSTFLRGGHQNCDVYVIGSYDESFNDPDVQEFIASFVAMGKGIIVVGPDLMPSRFYAPDTPAVPAVPKPPAAQGAAQPQTQPDNSGHMGGGAWGRRSLIGRYDGSTSNLLGAGAPTKETTKQMWEAEGADAVGSGYVIVRRSLQTGTTNLAVNTLAAKLQFAISNIINDPGGKLLLSGSPAGNGLVAAQIYLSYLLGQRNLTYNERTDIRETVSQVKLSIPAGTTTADNLLQLLSDIEAEEKKWPMFPPFIRLKPPSPPPQYFSPPPRAPPLYISPPPAPANLPPNVSYIGCYCEFRDNRKIGIPLVSSRPGLTVNMCWNVSTSAPNNAKAGYLLGLQLTNCYGTPLPPAGILSSRLPDIACDKTCKNQPGQACGGFGIPGLLPEGADPISVYMLV
ncbi:hypothetical protein VOLCADRAFT_107535 [Volvox carteri f. nagariensis]|uniref:WSC domain-containing protein n=1 Tax=Volvox carteri f. nagariensis TaxID=3068 RepID=D8UEN8_VOLCA|nr:uncharacterized protein VOLCADRAFT_107535 [Volvox carteri f. nagariensis]EFJ41767.1 hypothetical protein VOLCADRAFT_107535 [Volvox carteri f. nagariensis]|eukprot:XP_002957113.1 hypothetical protein VOLCADRAFT_107535 [Volvox carteri f. nagariensis]